jgi:peroxiredoxin
MQSRIYFAVAAAFAGLALLAGAPRLSGQTAIDFALKDLDGRTVRLSDFRSKAVVLVDFWATWCIPCLKELTHFQKFYETYKDQGFVVLAVSVDGPESAAMVRPFVNRFKYAFPVLLDAESRVIALYNPRVALPYTVLVDREGNVRYAKQGYSPGDEKIMEDTIVRLLRPAGAARERRIAVRANEAFLSRAFTDDDYVVNQLDLTVSSGPFLAGVRADANLDFSPRQSDFSLAKRFFEVNAGRWGLRLGDFYSTLGRGLAFSLLKTFEKEGLEYIIDTTVDGGKASVALKPFLAEAFGGWIERRETGEKDRVLGGTLGFSWKSVGEIRLNLLGSGLEKGSPYGTKSVAMGSLSFDVPNWKDAFKFYGEFLFLRKTKHYADASLSGHGVYLEAGLFRKNLGLVFEFKDYENLDYEYNRPPLLESEQIPVLANQYVTSAAGVVGAAARLDATLSPTAVFSTRVSWQKDCRGEAGRRIAHVFASFEKKFKETGWLSALAGYRHEDAGSLVFYYTSGATFHGQANLSYPLTARLSLELDVEAKHFDGRFHDYGERRSFLSLHYSPHWVFTALADWTDDPEILFFKNRKNWPGVQAEFRFGQGAAVRVFYGANKGGVKCAGGVCKFFPPFEGLRVDAVLRF